MMQASCSNNFERLTRTFGGFVVEMLNISSRMAGATWDIVGSYFANPEVYLVKTNVLSHHANILSESSVIGKLIF